MSAPRAIAQLVVDSIRIFGKATAAAGRQAAMNARHKPDAQQDTRGPGGSGGSKSLTSEMNMSLDEAYLILNVKKDDKMEAILSNYERIFKANGPPEPPKEKPGAQPTPQNARQRSKTKGPTHSHYLQSKVFRALERIKAERTDDVPAEGAAAEGGAAAAAAEGGAAAAAEAPEPPRDAPEGVAAEGVTFSAAPPGSSEGAAPGAASGAAPGADAGPIPTGAPKEGQQEGKSA